MVGDCDVHHPQSARYKYWRRFECLADDKSFVWAERSNVAVVVTVCHLNIKHPTKWWDSFAV